MIEVHRTLFDGAIDATIDGVRMIVPDDPANSHWQRIAAWEAEGNSTPPYVPPALDPLTLPMDRLTFWLAAAEIGVTKSGIRARIEAIPDDLARFQAIAYLDDAQIYRRHDPLLISMAEAEGITATELDSLWVWAVATYA